MERKTQLAALVPQGGSAVYIQGPSLSTVTEQRSSGMHETKPGQHLHQSSEECELDGRS
jgi:hypothetical protein